MLKKVKKAMKSQTSMPKEPILKANMVTMSKLKKDKRQRPKPTRRRLSQ